MKQQWAQLNSLFSQIPFCLSIIDVSGRFYLLKVEIKDNQLFKAKDLNLKFKDLITF
jgi:hypothetical protein